MPGLSHPLRRLIGCGLAASLSLSGCASLQSSDDNLLGLITPYRIDIVQGNVVTKEQIALVRPGISRIQVRDLLGSPLITDVFHADRWDYVFTIKRPGTQPQRRSVVAWFKDDKLERVDAPDDLPAEREFVAAISRSGEPRPPTTLELSDEQRKALPVPTKPPAESPAPIPGPARPYPPLEPS
jgi:outer membrane protein assembly factor BamE